MKGGFMKIEKLPNDFQNIVDTNNGLRQYLRNLLVGRPRTPRSWLYEGKSDREVLSMWMKQLDKLKSGSHNERLVYQFELSKLEKFGPQGEVKPIKELMDLVTEGFKFGSSPKPKIFDSPKWLEAKELSIKYLFKETGIYHSLTPRALKHVVDDMRSRDTLESNSGWPDFGRRKKPEHLSRAYEAIASGAWRDYPAIVLFRNYNAKTRPVWMYPLATNILEGSYTQPLKEAIMKSSLQFFAPWRGYDHVLARISAHYAKGEFLSASDFSHTDAHFTRWAMLEVYDVIKHAFKPCYWDGLKESMLHVCSIPIIVGPDTWITGDHGVSSGSDWTNDVETYLDFIAEEYLTSLGLVKEPDTAIGDDVSHRNDVFNPDFADQAAAEYQQMGFDVNPEKVTNERDWVKYLQRLTIRGYNSNRFYEIKGKKYEFLRGVYSTVRALNSSLNPEKFHSPKLWSKQMFAVRQFMILENCIDHPYFHQFVKFVCAGHPYLKEFANQPKLKIDEAQAKSRILPGLNPTYNQEKRDKPLSSFESIKLAQKL